MTKQDFFRGLFFALTFAAGTAVLALAFGSQEITDYYQLKIHTETKRRLCEKIETLIADYNSLITEIQADPNVLQKVAPAILGIETPDANSARPQFLDPNLAAVSRELLKQADKTNNQSHTLPRWVQNCQTKPARAVLIISGSGLIFVAFVCFGKKKPQKSIET